MFPLVGSQLMLVCMHYFIWSDLYHQPVAQGTQGVETNFAAEETDIQREEVNWGVPLRKGQSLYLNFSSLESRRRMCSSTLCFFLCKTAQKTYIFLFAFIFEETWV